MSRLRYADLKGSIGSSGLTSSATSHTFTAPLTCENGVTIPTLTGSDYFLLSILDSSGNLSEVIQVTAYNSSTGVATIVRAQEGTSGVAHSSGDKVTMACYASDFATPASVSGSGSGDLTQTSTTMTDLISLTIPAKAGDRLLCTFTASVFNNTAGDLVDVAINIGGTDRVINANVAAVALTAVGIVAQVLYTVASGDISAGLVTVKARWRTSAHSGFMLNSAGRLPQLTALNVT